MSDRTNIEWADASWNPIRARDTWTGNHGWHCEHVSEACRYCYAETMNKWRGTGYDYKPGHVSVPFSKGDGVEVFLDDKMLLTPLKWKKPRMIFVCSMTDLFADFVTDEQIDRVFAVMAQAPQHTFQVLTKRSARMLRYVGERHSRNEVELAAEGIKPSKGLPVSPKWCFAWPLPNVWLGVSAEDQARWDERKEDLRNTPAAVHIASFEPLLGPIVEPRLAEFIQWAITGGESGPHARPMHPDWERKIRDDCAAAGVPYFKKQWGEWAPVCALDDDAIERLYHPAPDEHPEATRVCKVKSLVLHTDGSQHKLIDPIAFTSGKDAMTMFRVGKKRAGRLLDGRTWNQMPGAKQRPHRQAGSDRVADRPCQDAPMTVTP
jgi:protein gp37